MQSSPLTEASPYQKLHSFLICCTSPCVSCYYSGEDLFWVCTLIYTCVLHPELLSELVLIKIITIIITFWPIRFEYLSVFWCKYNEPHTEMIVVLLLLCQFYLSDFEKSSQLQHDMSLCTLRLKCSFFSHFSQNRCIAVTAITDC